MINLNLNMGDAHVRVAKLALDAERHREAWRVLPGDVRLAHRELANFAETQARIGRLRREEREVARIHMTRVEQHHEAVRRQITTLRSSTSGHALAGQYQQLQASGRLMGVIGNDPAMLALHRQHAALAKLEAQDAAMVSSRDFFESNHATGKSNVGYWANRAAWGSNGDGSPKSPGQWARDGVVDTASKVKRGVQMASNVFMAFQGAQLVVQSMDAFEQRAELMQSLGARMGNQFDQVGETLDNLRAKFAFTRGQLAPAMEQMVRLLGSTDLASGAAGFARAMGLEPGQVAGHFAHMAQFGGVNPDFLERAMVGAGMRSRPEAYLGMLGSAQGALGSGFHTVPESMAARYVAGVSRAFGPQFQGERGQAMIGQIIGGMRQQGSPLGHALKMEAARRMGSIDLGGGVKLSTNTYRGMVGAMESGDPRFLEQFYKVVRERHGTGEMARSLFGNELGMNVWQSERLFNDMTQNKGRLPTEKQLAANPNLDTDRAAAEQGPAYRMQRLKASFEQDVYEKLGQHLLPVAEDFKEAGLRLMQGLSAATSAMDVFNAAKSAAAAITTDTHSPLTPWVTGGLTAANSDSIMGFAVKAGALFGMGAGNGRGNDKDSAISEGLRYLGIID